MIIFLDMDDVLVHLNVKIAEALGLTEEQLYEKWPPGVYQANDAFGCKSEEIWGRAKEDPEFWSHAPAYPWSHEIWKKCNSLAETFILTAPIHSAPELVPTCLSGKIKWIHQFTGSERFDHYVMTRRKDLCAKPNCLLIDDREVNCNAFVKAGGKALLFPAIGNRLHQHRKEAYAYILPQLEQIVAEMKMEEMSTVLEAEAWDGL